MRLIFILAGLSLGAAPSLVPPPADLSPAMWHAAGLAAMMALWWLTEPVPLAATALLPVALWPLLTAGPMVETAARYAHALIFLFLGGFLLAKAMERWGLHRRIAHSVLSLTGDGPRQILAGFMAATAFLSLWISNTAAAMVMAPIAAASCSAGPAGTARATNLMLAVAFAATIGGMGSLIGTPPNALFAAYAEDKFGIEIGFARWAVVGMPVALCLLAITWAWLAWRTGPRDGAAPEMPEPPPITTPERRVAAIAALTALAWVTRPLIEALAPGLALSDAGIALLAALALFLLPSGRGGALLDWETAAGIRWDILILFGGGLALAGILEESGLVGWIGGRSEGLAGLSVLAVTLALAALIVGIGELASNTAMAAVFLPVAAAIAPALGMDPVAFMLPVALAASIGFMLPVATPPNAIVFSHPAVTRREMIVAGAPLDIIGVALAAGAGVVLGRLVL